MSVWTMDQVYAAGRIRGTVHLDKEAEDRSDGMASAAVRDMLAKRIIDMGHPLGVEINAADIEYVAEESPEVPWSIKLLARWNPTTNGVELRGGPKDGERWAVQRVGDPLVVESMDATPWLGDDVATEAALGINRVTYELAGWNESERIWVYEVRR